MNMQKMVTLNKLEGGLELFVKEVNVCVPLVDTTILKELKEATLVGKHFRRNMLILEQDGNECKVYVKKTGEPVAMFRTVQESDTIVPVVEENIFAEELDSEF